jgi:hypothetical protein
MLTLEQFARKGGHARARLLSKKLRSRIARHAARTRWAGHKKKKARK